MTFINIAAYRFARDLPLETMRSVLYALSDEYHVRGSILLTPEGINVFIAGFREAVDVILDYLRSYPQLKDLEVKESLSETQSFNRMVVKIKQEIISFGQGIEPDKFTGARISPAMFKQWLDENRDMTILDTRNNFEYDVGSFERAIPANITGFREFTETTARMPEEAKNKPLVMFCTGGIRCEKASAYMIQHGFKDVYQLDGGILKYFEDVGGAHYRGDCFVFDQRVALKPDLTAADTKQCFGCRAVLSAEDLANPFTIPGERCPHCVDALRPANRIKRRSRAEQIRARLNPLPGASPVTNQRPLNIPGRYAGMTAWDFLTTQHGHCGEDYWKNAFQEKCVKYKDGLDVEAHHVLNEGAELVVLEPNHIEPSVNTSIDVLYEDDAMLVVNKPAPLPVHPSGRYHRNTLTQFLEGIIPGVELRPVHRLDADTSGVLIFAKHAEDARNLSMQFEQQQIQKDYLAEVVGCPAHQTMACTVPIDASVQTAGSRKTSDAGLSARTTIKLLKETRPGHSLLQLTPHTGRTHQLRVHLAHMGLPVAGDPVYTSDAESNAPLTSDAGSLRLHAWRLRMLHPRSGKVLTLHAPKPDWAR